MVHGQERNDIMIKYWKILVLLVCVFGGLMAITFRPPVDGVEIAYISDYSPAKDVLSHGMILASVNGQLIENMDQWIEIEPTLSGPVKLVVNGNSYDFFVDRSNISDIGIDVMNIDSTNLDFGLDIKGGTRVILKPQAENSSSEVIDQIMETLKTRANIYGLKEINFYPVQSSTGEYFIQIEAAGVGREIVNDLLSKQGKFEAKIIKPVDLVNGQGVFDLIDNKYTVTEGENNSVKIGDTVVIQGDKFNLEGIDFEYANRTGNELFFIGNAYDGKDIELIMTDSQHAAIMPVGEGFRFYFTVSVSTRGAEKFAKITSGIPARMDMNSGDYYLKDSRIILYLDEQPVSDLQISSDLGGKIYTTPQIQGYREDKEGAVSETMRLQTILRSGALPVSMETVSVSVISPKLGEGFVTSAAYAGLLAALMVVVVVFIRYRSFKIAIPMVLISLSEIIILLGISTANDTGIWAAVLVVNLIIMGVAWWKKQEIDTFTAIGVVLIPILGMLSWTIDLPAIGGIIAAIGTGIDHMIVIADETLSGEKKDRKMLIGVKDKIKKAFFIIFGSAATTIAAMIPLMSIGVGLIRSFAITTIIGVLIGILITRPVYARLIELSADKK
ncbi:MAG: hypothetical protein JW716_03005 [Candidatus Aenigmarchaeota archaeon]|nr:hypothetical protein [Candidatus Aenigmarchaeota archaeon]